MTESRPLDADGNPPMPGQMDIDEVRAESTEDRIHRKSREAQNRPMSAAEVVAHRLSQEDTE
jgi:hypothetical protein